MIRMEKLRKMRRYQTKTKTKRPSSVEAESSKHKVPEKKVTAATAAKVLSGG